MALRPRRPGACWGAGTWMGSLPSLPDSRAVGLGLPGPAVAAAAGWGRLGQAGSERKAPGRQAEGGWPRMTGPPSPALSPWGRGVCGGPPQMAQASEKRCHPPASVTSSSPSPLLVYPHLCVHSPVCLHPESLFPAFTTFPYLCVCHSSLCVPVCLCACLSLSLSPCFPLPVSFSASLCLCFPPSVSLSEPLSFHPMSQSVPPVPAPPSPLLEPRWAPGLLWAPPFSIPRSRGKLGRHRGGAAAWWRGRTEG